MTSLYDHSVLVRTFRDTAQQVWCDISQLRSEASYVLVAPVQNVVFVWIGRTCKSSDSQLAGWTANIILSKDFAHSASLETLLEGTEKVEILTLFLEALKANIVGTYHDH